MDYQQQPFSPAPVPPKKNNTAIIITVIICAALIIITALIVFMVVSTNNRSNGGAPAPSPTSATHPEITAETEPQTDAVTEKETLKATEAPLLMPNMIYHTEGYAVDEIKKLGLEPDVIHVETDKHRAGDVYDQSPDPGEPVKKGELVFLYVATKPEPTKAPVTSPPSTEWPPKGALLYVCADDYVSLREMPGENYPEMARIPRGEMMGYMNSKKGPWLYVMYGNLKGYVYADYVTTERVR